MQSDVTQIKCSDEFVTMPLSLYEEVRLFCRHHGETDLPGFAEFQAVTDAVFEPADIPKFRKPKDVTPPTE